MIFDQTPPSAGYPRFEVVDPDRRRDTSQELECPVVAGKPGEHVFAPAPDDGPHPGVGQRHYECRNLRLSAKFMDIDLLLKPVRLTLCPGLGLHTAERGRERGLAPPFDKPVDTHVAPRISVVHAESFVQYLNGFRSLLSFLFLYPLENKGFEGSACFLLERSPIHGPCPLPSEPVSQGAFVHAKGGRDIPDTFVVC